MSGQVLGELSFYQTTTMQRLKYGIWYVISAHTWPDMWLFIQVVIKVNHVSKKGPTRHLVSKYYGNELWLTDISLK